MAGAQAGTTRVARGKPEARTDRVLFTVEGPDPGQARRAIAAVPHDSVLIFATDPATSELADVRRLVERAGARCRVERVPRDDLDAAFRQLAAAFAREASAERVCQVNAGRDANLLSSAALLACLHEGVEAVFLHEKGVTPLPVLARMPLRDLLTERERAALAAFPPAGLSIAQVSREDTKALNALKKGALVELLGERLVLTAQGRAFRAHLGTV